MNDLAFLTQFLTPEVEAFLFGAANFFATWLGSKVHKDANKVFAVMTPFIAIIYVTTTFDWSRPIAPQMAGKLLIVATSSTGIWKWWRDISGKTARKEEALVEKGRTLANAENQQNVTVIPVQSDSPVTFGQPVQVSSASDTVAVSDTLQASELLSVQSKDLTQAHSPSTQIDGVIKDQEL
jgi:hypothetical protein